MQLPALAVRTPNIAGNILAAEQIKGLEAQNRLADLKMQREQQTQNLLGQIFQPRQAATSDQATYNALAANGGPTPEAAAALEATPTAPATSSASGLQTDAFRKLAAINPSYANAVASTISNMDKVQAAETKRKNDMVARMAIAVESAPLAQRPAVYAQMLAQAKAAGLPIDHMPQNYDPQAVHQILITSMATDDLLKMEKPASKVGGLAYDLQRNIITPEQYQTGMAALNKPLVQLNQTQETAQQKAYGKGVGEYYSKRFTTLQTAADTARMQNSRLDRLDQLLDQTFTGTFAGKIVDIKAAAKTFGIDLTSLPGNVAPAQAAMALGNQMALELRNPAGGAGMPGSMSNSDRDFLQSMVPGLAQTPEGRKLLISALKKVNRRSIDVARMARDYARKHGGLDAGFEGELQAWSDKNPLFSKSDLTLREKSRLPQMPSGTQDEQNAWYGNLKVGTYFIGPDGKPMQKTEGVKKK